MINRPSHLPRWKILGGVVLLQWILLPYWAVAPASPYFIVGAGAVNMIWVALFFLRQPVHTWFVRRPVWQPLVLIGLLVMAVLLTNAVLGSGIYASYVTVQCFALTAVMLSGLPSQHTPAIPWLVLAGLWLIIALMALTASALDLRGTYSADEAEWADVAVSWYEVSGLYAPHWLEEPIVITPGVGWSVAGYGWFLYHVDFSRYIGRLWEATMNGLTWVALGLLMWRIFTLRVALITILVAVSAFIIYDTPDYRPHTQIAPAMFVFILMIYEAYRPGARRRYVWHVLVGLAGTLTLQLHAVGITLLLGSLLFYSTQAIIMWNASFYQRMHPVLFFMLGLMIGGAVFYVANIVPVGGLAVYWDQLAGTRFNFTRNLEGLFYLPAPTLALSVGGILYALLYRRELGSLLLIVACMILGIILMDPTGYFIVHRLWWIPFIGILLSYSWQQTASLDYRTMIMTVVVVLCLSSPWLLNIIRDGSIQAIATGQLYDATVRLGESVLPYIDPEDRVAAPSDLMWVLRDQANYISFDAEIEVSMARAINRQWVWERYIPDTIIDVPRLTPIPPGLQYLIETEAYRICHQFNIQAQDVYILKRDCTQL